MVITNRIAKLTNILNDCRDNLNALSVAGTNNCGRVFATDQNIRIVIAELAKIAEEIACKKEVETEDDCNSDEIQSES